MAGDLPPGRWSALLVGAWWPARPDAPMAGVTYWRKAAQLKRNEANDLRNERSLLAVNQGRTADDLLERYWRGEQRLATIAHQCEVKSDQSEQVADAVNYLRDRLTEIAQSGNQQINQILAGKGPIEAKVAAVNAVIEQSNAMADHVGATAMSNIIDATQRVFDETIGGDAHTWLRDHGVSLDTPARPRPVTAEDMTSMTANSPAGSPFGAAPSAPSHSTTTSGPPTAPTPTSPFGTAPMVLSSSSTSSGPPTAPTPTSPFGTAPMPPGPHRVPSHHPYPQRPRRWCWWPVSTGRWHATSSGGGNSAVIPTVVGPVVHHRDDDGHAGRGRCTGAVGRGAARGNRTPAATGATPTTPTVTTPTVATATTAGIPHIPDSAPTPARHRSRHQPPTTPAP